jgi:hypothetical protein
LGGSAVTAIKPILGDCDKAGRVGTDQ